ncbi:hypothetical protein HPB48_008729 [Haemaphysalis longicornis]|uniref:CCHC-type domain-containing protein n=1 Tax=Haemaphysalis longicornis TaxID=44386 RepID=A0A9J6G657_HAELO|nr:hypothetical protein HPB48_008729 [Haemaphysalis longicornis]
MKKATRGPNKQYRFHLGCRVLDPVSGISDRGDLEIPQRGLLNWRRAGLAPPVGFSTAATPALRARQDGVYRGRGRYFSGRNIMTRSCGLAPSRLTTTCSRRRNRRTPPPGGIENGQGKNAKKETQKRVNYPIKRRQPLTRLPMSDYKIIYRTGRRPGLSPVNGGMLLQTVCRCADVDFAIARTQDKAYVAAPDDAIKGIIYNAVYDQTQDEIFEDIINLNKSRKLHNCRCQATRQNQEVPREIIFFGSIYTCYPFKAKVETCFNCRRAGHREDVCPKEKTGLCRRCGEQHPVKEQPGLHTQMHPVQWRSFHGHQEMQAAFRETRQFQGKDVYQYREPVATRTAAARTGERRASPVQKPIQIELQDRKKAQQKPLQLLPTPPEVREQGTSKPAPSPQQRYPNQKEKLLR